MVIETTSWLTKYDILVLPCFRINTTPQHAQLRPLWPCLWLLYL